MSAARIQFQWLFSLPPALRHQIVFPLKRDVLDLRILKRPFAHTPSYAYAKPARKPPSPVRRVPEISPANKKAARIPPSRPSSASSDILNLLSTADRVLLYKAPSHTSFFVCSWLFGSAIIGSAVIHASFTADDKQLPWYSRLLTSGLALFLAIIGTTFLLAPTKMIRSVALARNQITNAMFLRFETRPGIPFISSALGGNAINAPLNHVHIDKAINGDALPPYFNIPLQSAEQFTQANSEDLQAPKQGVLARLRRFTGSVVNIGPNLWWNTRRMFLRDGMVYVEIVGHGYWKLDLRDAELLDYGKPLTSTMTPMALDRSLLGKLRTLAGR